MRDEDLAPLAAEALSAIIGVVVEKALARPPKRWDPDAEEDEDEEEEPGPEADLPKPEPEALAAWWEKAKPKLDPGQRWLRGRPWSLDLVMHELQAGPARRRCALALELAAHSGGQAQLAWDALSTRQLADLHAFRNGVTHAAKPLTHPGFVPGWSPRAPAGPVPTAGSSKPIALVAGSSRWTSEALAVTGIGMVSSLGDEVVTSCAAARAGVTRTRGLEGWRVLDPEEGEGTPAIGHAVAGLDGFSGLGRLACLGAAALHDLLGRSAPEPGVRTGLFLVLPSGWMLDAADRISAAGIPPDRDEEEEPAEPEEVEPDPPGGPPEFERAELQRKLLADQLLPRLLDLALLPGGFQQTRLFFSDSPGFAEALSAAREALVGRLLERCVVGGIDSLLDPAQLEALAVLGMLKAPQTPTGLAPGEAAAFVQVELPDQARRRKAQVLCYLDAWSSASEPQDALAAESYLGQALAGAIGSTLDRIGDAGHALRLVIANQNGTDPRAQDWGHALVRLQKRSFPEVASWFPALHFGETGAATGPVSVCMGARAFARGYAPSPDLLAWLWSETGARASFCVRAAERAE